MIFWFLFCLFNAVTGYKLRWEGLSRLTPGFYSNVGPFSYSDPGDPLKDSLKQKAGEVERWLSWYKEKLNIEHELERLENKLTFINSEIIRHYKYIGLYDHTDMHLTREQQKEMVRNDVPFQNYLNSIREVDRLQQKKNDFLSKAQVHTESLEAIKQKVAIIDFDKWIISVRKHIEAAKSRITYYETLKKNAAHSKAVELESSIAELRGLIRELEKIQDKHHPEFTYSEYDTNDVSPTEKNNLPENAFERVPNKVSN